MFRESRGYRFLLLFVCKGVSSHEGDRSYGFHREDSTDDCCRFKQHQNYQHRYYKRRYVRANTHKRQSRMTGWSWTGVHGVGVNWKYEIGESLSSYPEIIFLVSSASFDDVFTIIWFFFHTNCVFSFKVPFRAEACSYRRSCVIFSWKKRIGKRNLFASICD